MVEQTLPRVEQSQLEPGALEVASQVESIATGGSPTQVTEALQQLAGAEAETEKTAKSPDIKADAAGYADRYANNKFAKPLEQTDSDFIAGAKDKGKAEKQIATKNGIVDRVDKVVANGSVHIEAGLKAVVQRQESVSARPLSEYGPNIDRALQEKIGVVLAPTKEILKGQPEKFQKAEQYANQLLADAQAMASEQVQGLPDAVREQKKKEILDVALRRIEEAVDAITYQDVCASRLTLGDHGWDHLYQDYRDSQVLAQGYKAGQDGGPAALTAKERFMLGMAAAYHDIGYTTPETHLEQQKGAHNYGTFDAGHPMVSAAHLLQIKDRFVGVGDQAGIFTEDEFNGLYQIVANHENPERAAQAGQYEHLSKAFATADASAAFGSEKLPPIMSELPEATGYLAQLSFQEDLRELSENLAELQTQADAKGTEISWPNLDKTVRELLTDVRGAYEEMKQITLQNKDSLTKMIREKFSTQTADALINSLDHFTGVSLRFTLGRVAGEMDAVRLDDQNRPVLPVKSGVGAECDREGYFRGAQEAAASQTVKVFMEASSAQLSKDEIRDLTSVLKYPPDSLQQVPESVRDMVELQQRTLPDNKTYTVVSLVSRDKKSPLVVEYDPVAKSEASAQFSDKTLSSVRSAQRQLGSIRNKFRLSQDVVSHINTQVTQELGAAK
ncbi:hypothetical protein KBC79_02295 [Candidatus Woesebacteria bacterium]|nr:hypothetical protein [Candidatus Woesebacteria bacterium]